LTFDPEGSERRLRRTSWLLAGLFTLLGLPFGLGFAAGVLAGAVLSLLNLEGLARLVRWVTELSSGRASRAVVLGVGFRYLLLGIGLFVILSVWRVNVLALSLGLSAPVGAVVLELARDAIREFRNRSDSDE
jgi:hypothetical protein